MFLVIKIAMFLAMKGIKPQGKPWTRTKKRMRFFVPFRGKPRGFHLYCLRRSEMNVCSHSFYSLSSAYKEKSGKNPGFIVHSFLQ